MKFDDRRMPKSKSVESILPILTVYRINLKFKTKLKSS